MAADPGLEFATAKLIAKVGEGLEITSAGIGIDLAADPGLVFSSGDIKVVVGAGMELTSSGIEIDLAANPGLAFSSGDLIVVVGAGLELSSSGIEIDLAANGGLAFSSGDLIVIVGDGLELTVTGIEIDLAANPGLAFSSGDLIVTVGAGLELTMTGVEIDLATDPGLEFSSGDIRVKIKAAGGITRDGDGLSTTKVFSSGFFTPTRTNSSNVASSTAYEGVYQQVGDVVTVSLRVDVTPTTTGVNTDLIMSLPVALNNDFPGFLQAFGTAITHNNPDDGVGAVIFSNSGAQTVILRCVPSTTGLKGFHLSFAYSIDQPA